MFRFSKLFLIATLFISYLFTNKLSASNFIPANHQYIQYFGRWDFSDPFAPTHCWPGTYIYIEFEGTSIGVKMNDNVCYYNVYIDGKLYSIFHPTTSGITAYTLASGLAEGQHTLLLSKRNETSWAKFSFNGFILDDGKNILPPIEKPTKKIEFVGDSFTSASGNEATEIGTPADVNKVTNIDEGFGPLTAKHFGAQYQMSSISGYGMVMDYLGNSSGNVPAYFDRSLIISDQPKWNFDLFNPNLVVVCLGLNDYNGFGGYTTGTVSSANKDLFKSRYHLFIGRLRDYYPGVKILAVAAHVEWIQTTVKEIVFEEKQNGFNDVYYTDFPYYSGGYVNNGHPNVETHHKISERLIAAIDTINAWTPSTDNIPPTITKIVSSKHFTVYEKKYTLTVQTDSYANLKYSTNDKSFDEMEFNFTTTGKKQHFVELECEHGKEYKYFIRAIDLFGNKMDTSAAINFNVDTTKVLLNWKSPKYDNSKWKSGTTPIGSGLSNSIKTAINKVNTVYLRKKVFIEDASKITGLGCLINGCDGAVLFLNGKEIQRLNISSEADLTFNLFASSAKTLNTIVVINSANGLSNLKTGENVFAVEMHASSSSADVLFDSQLFDNNYSLIYKLSSEWVYYDGGNQPEDQIADKVTGINSNNQNLPEDFVLYQNYPNPFNPETTIEYKINKENYVSLKLYDVLGREVTTFLEEYKAPGFYSFNISASNNKLSTGIYLIRLKSGNSMQTKKIMLIK